MIINWANIDLIQKENTVVLSNRNTRQWLEIEKRTYQFLLANYFYQRDVFVEKLCEEQNELPKDTIYFVDNMIAYGFLSNNSRTEKRIVSFYITDKCNLHCKYCYRSAKVDNQGYFDIKHIDEVFSKLTIKFDCQTIVVTGGEPLLHPNVRYILETARRYFSSVILQTNGTLINNDNIKWIKECVNRIRIGLDGSNSQINDEIRGKGSFERIINGIDIVKQHKVSLTLSTTLYASNIGDVETMMMLAENKDAEIVFTDFMPIGRGEDHTENILVNEKKNANQLSDIRCGAFTKKFAIDHEGNVYPCDELMSSEFLIGSVFTINEINVYDNIFIRELISRNIYTLDKCGKCQFRYNCNALCPAKTYRDNKTISVTDINCEQVHK